MTARRSAFVRPIHAQQHPDAEVEALEHEVADPQDRDEDEPDDLQGGVLVHRGASVGEREVGFAGARRRRLVLEALARLAAHDPQRDGAQDGVEPR